MIFRTEIYFVCFQLRIYDNKHIQLRLDMFDQDKKDLKIMTGIESTNFFLLCFFKFFSGDIV